jgi:hypothetical protein
MELARRKGLRIRTLAQHPHALKEWEGELNEPSYFPLLFQRVSTDRLRAFAALARSVLDEKDKYLIVAAIVGSYFLSTPRG